MASITSQITPGLIVEVSGTYYSVESSVKVMVPKGTPFVKAKLKNLATGKVSERNFKPGQKVNTITATDVHLEYLYAENDGYVFFDIDNLEQQLVAQRVVGNKRHYLKEGVEVMGQLYGGVIGSIELPQFLELMVSHIQEGKDDGLAIAQMGKRAELETGASLEVPPFIEAGDIVKIDTRSGEFIQRV